MCVTVLILKVLNMGVNLDKLGGGGLPPLEHFENLGVETFIMRKIFSQNLMQKGKETLNFLPQSNREDFFPKPYKGREWRRNTLPQINQGRVRHFGFSPIPTGKKTKPYV